MEDAKVAVVAGSTSGIGRAAALRLADEGWWVCAAGQDHQRADALQRELGGRGTVWTGDLTGADAPAALIDHARTQRGRVDAVVNSAGCHKLAPLDELKPEDLDALLALNVRAAVLLSQAAVRAMREQGSGVIVNISSEAGLVAVPGQVAYNISKAAVVMLTKSIAADYAAEGIRAVGVAPGTTRTPLVEAAIASAPDPVSHERTLAESRPARRLGDPEEVAAAIAFACSDAASFMHGAELVIDGGYTAV